MSLRDFMLRPGLRLRGWVPKPSLWPPQPLMVARSDRPTDADVGTARLAGATDAAARRPGRRGRGGRALSSSGRGSGPAPARRPSPAGKVGLREAGVAGANPSRREGRRGCRVSSPRAARPKRKGGHCLLDWHYCSIAWPHPFPAGSLPSPHPSPGGAGVGGGRLWDPGSERVLPLFPHRLPLSTAPRGGSQHPHAHQRPVHASRPLLRWGPRLERRPPHPHPSSVPWAPLRRSRPYTRTHGAPSPTLPFAQPSSQDSGVVSGYAPPSTPHLDPVKNAVGSRKQTALRESLSSFCPVAQDFVLRGSD